MLCCVFWSQVESGENKAMAFILSWLSIRSFNLFWRMSVTGKIMQIFFKVQYQLLDDIIILLNIIFTSLHGYETTPGLSSNKQRHRLLLLKTGIHVTPTHL